MKLNNKGFAITGILYTIFILFLMILLSVVSGLNIKRQLLEKNMENIKETLKETCTATNDEIPAEGYVAKYSGKYTIKITTNENEEYEHTTYCPEGQRLIIQGSTPQESTIKKVNEDGTFTEITFISGNPTNVKSAKVVEFCTTDTPE